MKFFHRKTHYVPTFWGWLLILFAIFLLFFFFINNIAYFLSRNDTCNSKVLVIEGWIPEEGLRKAVQLYDSCGYEYMIMTGIPITQWTYSSPYSNMADASARSVKEMFFKDSIYTVSIPNTITRDRTYSTAVALKLKWNSYNIPYDDFDLFSMGAHARRSFNMYEKAFGKRIKGVIACEDDTFDIRKWYHTSRGFRTILSEFLSYTYALLFFNPDEQEVVEKIQLGSYIDSIQTKRFAKDKLFDKKETSPLNDSCIKYFRGLKYFPIHPDYKVTAFIERNTATEPFKMQTSGTREPNYIKFGTLHFTIRDTAQTLAVYQNLDLIRKDSSMNNHLFVPFKDLTSLQKSYGGGRYIDLQYNDSEIIVIDFNLAYNPYCAYDSRWSCPIPPDENHLSVHILAGEKKFY
ncbi:MAG: DUF1684 domain-containing protein [Lentimicrobiaceae bacterium]|jgi:uncharacterized protein (DUF1684 family)|nr:DUF1684 domain-containing protein [Lentimicrobiaceae bacterium]